MQIDSTLADSLMGSISDYLGDPILIDDPDGFTFKFFDTEGSEIASLIITAFETTSIPGMYEFKGDGGGSQITGDVIKSGRVASFKIENTAHGVCFIGSAGSWSDAADISFNERQWSSGDIIILTGLSMSIPLGSFTIL